MTPPGFVRFYEYLELRPAREPILAGDDRLRPGQGQPAGVAGQTSLDARQGILIPGRRGRVLKVSGLMLEVMQGGIRRELIAHSDLHGN